MTVADRVQNSIAGPVRSLFARHTDLIKNSGAMVLGAGFTSVFGFAFWWFAARTFAPEVIGVASAIISLIGVVAVLGDVGLCTLMTGEIIRWPERKEGLIAASMVTCLCTCLIVGAVSLPLSQFAMTLHSSAAIDIIMLVGCGLTAISMISDQAFVGMLQSTLRMLRQLVCSVLRVISIIILSVWSANEIILLISWFGSLGVSLVFGEALMRRYRQSFIHRPDFDLLWNLRRRAVGHYMLDLGMVLPPVVMPYVVTVLISATSNAAFTVIWLVVGVGSVVPSALATVLFPVLRAEPDQYRQKMRLSLFASLAFSVVFALALWISSAHILTLFNPRYLEIEHSQWLGLLGFGLLGSAVRYHVAAAARLGNRMRQASVWVCLAALFEVAVAIAGSLYGGVAGLCIGWPVATTIEGIIMWVFANPCVPPKDHPAH